MQTQLTQAFILVVLAFGGLAPATAQDEQRDIKATEVLKSRPAGPKRQAPAPPPRYRAAPPVAAAKKAAQRSRPRRARERGSPNDNPKTPDRAAHTFPVGPPPQDKTYATLGVTLWRGRAASDAEKQDAKIAKVQVKERFLVFERLSDNDTARDGDMLQLTIECLAHDASRAAYLYVINREQYPDGTHGPARLIFPTRKTFGGDNRVLPGKLVTLPDPRRPWQISRSTSGQVQEFETYTIIVSPTPLALELNGPPLPGEQVALWEREWGANVARADLQSATGRLLTVREQTASGDPHATVRDTKELDDDLTQDDPPPQIVFRKTMTPGSQMLATIRLRYQEP